MNTLATEPRQHTCPVCTKNLSVVKKSSQVAVEGRTYCCQACANIDAVNAKTTKSRHRHSVSRSPFTQRIS
ncbi:MAG: hypothetical protein ACLFVC_07830 [Opitutales bacterium]